MVLKLLQRGVVVEELVGQVSASSLGCVGVVGVSYTRNRGPLIRPSCVLIRSLDLPHVPFLYVASLEVA